MNEKPSIVIVSCSKTRPKSLIKLITKNAHIEDDPSDVHKVSLPWTIDTKYYTAEINLIGITEDYQRSEEFNKNVEALVIHIDTNKETGLEDLAVWSKLEEDCNPEIKLLIANYCTNDTKITKAKAIGWCLKRGFELIELYPSSTETQDQDVIEEKIGVDRIVEALQTHTWPSLVMKSQNNSPVNKDDKNLVNACENFLTAGDEGDDFTDLFAQLNMMKESLQSLPMNQRKQCAEQVVTAFWKAIGGDEEETADI